MSNVVKTNIDEAIARIDDWKGKEIHYESVAGGVTNPEFQSICRRYTAFPENSGRRNRFH